MSHSINTRDFVIESIKAILYFSATSRGFYNILDEVSYRFDESIRGKQAKASHAWRSAIWGSLEMLINEVENGKALIDIMPIRDDFVI